MQISEVQLLSAKIKENMEKVIVGKSDKIYLNLYDLTNCLTKYLMRL